MMRSIRNTLGILAAAASLAMAADPIKVQAVMSQGTVLPGSPGGQASILVQVNDRASGFPITGLGQQAFAVVDHMTLPGQKCGFSNSIVGFAEAGDGAYEIKVALPAATALPVCMWAKGVYLAGIKVQGGASGTGETIAAMTVR